MGIDNPTRGGAATSLPAAPPPGAGPKLGRRALLATAGIGACAVATPFVVQKGAELAGTEVGTLLHAEIGTLEGVAIDDAIAVAEVTRKGVQYLVVPLARFVATLSGGGLLVLLTALQALRNVIGLAHVESSVLDGLIGVVTSWHTNVALLPIALSAYATADILSAETYLKALKAKATSGGAS